MYKPTAITSLFTCLVVPLVALSATGCDPDIELDEAPSEAAELVSVAEMPEALQFTFSSAEVGEDEGMIGSVDDLDAGATEVVGIGEMTCASQVLNDPIDGATVAMTAAPNCGYTYNGSTSPNTAYDTATCPHQYVTEVTGTLGKPLSFYVNWRGSGLTSKSLCEVAHISLTAFGALTATNWVKIGTTSMHGQWVQGELFSFCTWVYDAGKGPIPSLGNHSYIKVRTAAQATGLGIFKQRVESGVVHGPGPC